MLLSYLKEKCHYMDKLELCIEHRRHGTELTRNCPNSSNSHNKVKRQKVEHIFQMSVFRMWSSTTSHLCFIPTPLTDEIIDL